MNCLFDFSKNIHPEFIILVILVINSNVNINILDAKSNENLLEELRKVAEEQEQTMELQDQTIRKKELEIEKLEKGKMHWVSL